MRRSGPPTIAIAVLQEEIRRRRKRLPRLIAHGRLAGLEGLRRLDISQPPVTICYVHPPPGGCHFLEICPFAAMRWARGLILRIDTNRVPAKARLQRPPLPSPEGWVRHNG